MPSKDVFEGLVLGSDPEERKRKLTAGSDRGLLDMRQHILQLMHNNRPDESYKQYQDVLINEIEPIFNERGIEYRG
jgi:hypothetical protein